MLASGITFSFLFPSSAGSAVFPFGDNYFPTHSAPCLSSGGLWIGTSRLANTHKDVVEHIVVVDPGVKALRGVPAVAGRDKRDALIVVVRGSATYLLPLGENNEGAPSATVRTLEVTELGI